MPFSPQYYRSLGEETSKISWEVDRHQWFPSVIIKQISDLPLSFFFFLDQGMEIESDLYT